MLPIVVIAGLFALRATLHVDPLDNLAVTTPVTGDARTTIARAGSIYIARGGPVIVGFQSDRDVQLAVGGHRLRGRGLVKERFVLPHGATEIRIETAKTTALRLVWSPVGRRGDPEYIPASSLSPAPPDHAVFDGSVGAAPLDGMIALGLLATLVATALGLARHRLARVSRTTWLAILAIFIAALAIRLFDLEGFGQTWDEDVNWAAGRNYITNMLALDRSPDSWAWNFEHPPVMKYLEGIGAQFADGFGPARAMSAIWISLGCALLVPIGARLFRLRVGLLAGAIAALLPPLIAHGQIVGHESPTVLWWSLGILLALGVHDQLPDDERDAKRTILLRIAAVGAVLGIAIGSRFVNGLLGPLLAAIIVLRAPAAWRRHTVILGSIVGIATTVVVFYALWPRLWLDPIGAVRASLHKLSGVHSPEPFLGDRTNVPGAHYFVVYLFATLPLGVLATLPLFGWRAITDLRDGEARRSIIIVLLWIIVPLGVAASPVRQDGVRYVMPVITAFAIAAAAGIDHLMRRFQARAFVGASVALVGYLGVTAARVHPYYLDYFGEHTGGTGVVASRHRFETAWWGEGVDRAVDYVNAHAAPNAVVYRDCILPGHLAWFREDLWSSMIHDPTRATWIVAYSPYTTTCRIPADATRVFDVTVDGAVLAVVYRRGSGPQASGLRPQPE